MSPRDFCYWLQGFMELRQEGQGGMSEGQMKVVAEHLQLVFKKETQSQPSVGVAGDPFVGVQTNPFAFPHFSVHHIEPGTSC